MTHFDNGSYSNSQRNTTVVLDRARARRSETDGASSVIDLQNPRGGADGKDRLGGLDFASIDPQTASHIRSIAGLLPETGHQFHGFALERELGRGAFARVFLARQADVADRLVVVKIASEAAGEIRALVQLPHANIVPVFSVHDADSLQIVVMPYLGESTLADLLASITERNLPTSGAAIAEYCRGPQANAASMSPGLDSLRRLSYVDAIVSLATRLAEGLAFAHAHGIVHCDFKPANILLTAAGEPMLLDFNVAADTKKLGGTSIAIIGGSYPYMAPEQFAAFQGRAVSVDARCDLYSFGAVLFEMLTGHSPFAAAGKSIPTLLEHSLQVREASSLHLRTRNPAVSPGLEAIVRKCLEPDPSRRYQSACDLLDDLRRHQDDRPLRWASNPSWRERARKFARRHPSLLSATSVAAIACTILVGIAATAVGYRHQIALAAERTAAENNWTAFGAEARAAQYHLYAHPSDQDKLRRGTELARAALQRVGLLDNSADLGRLRQVPPDVHGELRSTAGQLLMLLTRSTLVAGPGDPTYRLSEAWRLSLLAEECNPQLASSPGLWAQRAEIASARGESDLAIQYRLMAGALPVRSARDRMWKATELTAQGRHRDAVSLLQATVNDTPRDVWAWLVLGNLHLDLGQAHRAEGCYDVCIALWPDFSWAWYNRGLARLKQKDFDRAVEDFSRSLELRPGTAEVYVDRALAEQGRNRLPEAEADLTRALDLGAPATRIYFMRARVRAKRHDAAGAAADRSVGLQREPTDERSWIARGIDRLSHDPTAALADFAAALKLNPRSVIALQNEAHVLAERLNRQVEAIAALDRAAELQPNSGEILSGRGVLLARMGRYEDARRDASAALRADASPARRYQAACIYALTSVDRPDDAIQALKLLAGALRDGYGHELLARDSDLDSLRGRPEFRQLVGASSALNR